MKIKPIRLAVLAACIFNVIPNFFPSLFNLVDNATLSDRYSTVITPANITFAVWGPIFLGTFAYTAYQLLPRTQNDPLINKITPFALGTYITCGIWPLFFGSKNFVIAQVFISLILACLVGAYLVIRDHAKTVGWTAQQRWLVQIPFSIYCAWVTVATAVGFGFTFRALGWEGGGINPTIWAVVVLAAVLLVVGGMVWLGRGNLPYTIVIVWAMLGIIINTGGNLPVNMMAGLIAVTVVVIAIWQLRQPNPTTRLAPSS